MGKKAKGSRKGKKAWRANISTDDIDEYFVRTTKDALTGGSLTSVPDDSLFFVDKSTDVSIKRKIEKHREKVLHYESVLQSNPFVKPIPSSASKKLKRKKKKEVVVPTESNGPKGSSKDDENDSDLGLPDLWDGKDEDGNAREKRRPVAAHIPAVEVEPLGCSFNPPFEAHQDSLAQAVAMEMQKSYKKELGPQPVPLVVPGEPIEEENKYFLDAEDGDEDMDEDDNEVPLVDENGNEIPLLQRTAKTKRVTRVELNRRARRKEVLKTEDEANKVKKLSTEIDSLPDLLKEIARDDEEKNKKHLRRAIAKQERLKFGPPRLGKHKFEPAPVQVLLSEEISGSIRKLKGCCTLARDRYKSLEKRGLLAPIVRRTRK